MIPISCSSPVGPVVAKTNCNKTETAVNGKTGSHHHPPHNPVSYSYGSVCLLCFRTKTCTSVKSDFEKHKDSRQTCVKYIVLLSRYLKLDTELTKISQKSFLNSATAVEDDLNDSDHEAYFKEEVNKFVVCDLCLPLAESFCKTYQEFEVLRMKLEAKIVESASYVEKSEVLAESMRIIRGVKKGGGGSKGPDPSEDVLLSFRKDLKTQGSNLITRKGPKLQLKRDKKAEDLIPFKVPKLSKDLGTSRNRSNETVTLNSDKVSPKPTAFKIVRKSVGGHAAAPAQVNIVRLSNDTSQANTSNNRSDSQVIGVVQKTTPRIPSPTAVRVQVPTTVSSSSLYNFNPSIQTIQANVLQPAPIWTSQSTSLFQTKLIPSTTSVTQLPRQDGTMTNVSNNMLSLHHIVPIISVQQCSINGCGLTFPKTEQGFKDMHRHLGTHNNMMCNKCPTMLEGPFELMSHELKHLPDNPNRMQGFQCPRCPYISPTRVEFQEHFLERHLNSKVELLRCGVCKRGYNHLKDEQYWSHVLNCHPDERTEDVSQLPSCMICRASFRKKVNLWKHLKNEHRINCQGGSYKCGHCSDSFFFQNIMELHQEFACESRNKHVCSYPGCNASFSKSISVKRHLERVHADFPLPECPVCKLKFSEMSKLRYHVMTHNGEQVKIVFPDGNTQEPQLIPVDALKVEETLTNSPVAAPVFNQFPAIANGQNFVNNVVVSTSIAPPSAPSTPTPIILSVSGASQYPVSSPMIVSSSFSNNLPPTNQVHSSGGVQADIDIKLLEKMFDDSNDNTPLMEFFENALPLPTDGGEEMPQPDEDPFAWMLSEDFQIN